MGGIADTAGTQGYGTFNGPIPAYGNPSYTDDPLDSMPDVSVAPFWADLEIGATFANGIFYQTDGANGSRTLSIEWVVYDTFGDGSDDTLYDFIATFFEATPDSVQYSYVRIGPPVYGYAIGAQSRDGEQVSSSCDVQIADR